QAVGDEFVLVSASVDVYLQHVCNLLNIDLICTQTEQVNNIYTGQYTTPDCSSEQKKRRILEKYHLDDYVAVYAYGNSLEDEEMLELADHAYMVGKHNHLPEISTYQKLA